MGETVQVRSVQLQTRSKESREWKLSKKCLQQHQQRVLVEGHYHVAL